MLYLKSFSAPRVLLFWIWTAWFFDSRRFVVGNQHRLVCYYRILLRMSDPHGLVPMLQFESSSLSSITSFCPAVLFHSGAISFRSSFRLPCHVISVKYLLWWRKPQPLFDVYAVFRNCDPHLWGCASQVVPQLCCRYACPCLCSVEKLAPAGLSSWL